MSDENESNVPAILMGLFVIVAVLIGGAYWFVTKRHEQMTLAREAEFQAHLAESQAMPSLVADDTFEFQLGQGLFSDGINLIKIKADGKAEYDYLVKDEEDRRWERKTFVVDKQSMDGLIDLINALKIKEMKNEYVDVGVAYGTHWRLLIKGGGKVKAIHCANDFPKAIRQLADHVHKSIIEPLGKEVKAVTVQEEEHVKRTGELWEATK